MSWRLETPVDIFIILLNLLTICILVEVVLSWISLAGGRVPWYNPVIQTIRKITDGVLSPIRNVLNRAMRGMSIGGMGLDLSPLVALILIHLLRGILMSIR